MVKTFEVSTLLGFFWHPRIFEMWYYANRELSKVRYPKEILDAVTARAREASPNECRGVISGVRTRRGVEVVALHELTPTSSRREGRKGTSSEGCEETGLLLSIEQQAKLLEHLKSAGTPAVCIYRSRVGACSDLSEDDEWMALQNGGPAYPGVEYLVLSLSDQGDPAARTFKWNGRSFVGRDLRLKGD